MRRYCPRWNQTILGLAAVLMLTAGACKRGAESTTSSPANKTGKNEPLRPFPEDIVKAWKAAGYAVGWARVEDGDQLTFVPPKQGKPGDLPAFRPDIGYKLDQLAKLPVPPQPFALELTGSQTTDAILKDLARLKTLRLLDLAFTKNVTDAGVKALEKALPECKVYR